MLSLAAEMYALCPSVVSWIRVSTSHVERQNLTMRMSMRRFTRLKTPAMAAGIADHVWELEELIALMPKPAAAPWGSKKRAIAG